MTGGARPAGFNVKVMAPSVYVPKREPIMLWILAIILVVLWLLGLITSYTFGGVIHILLVAALILLIVQLIQKRKLTS